MKKVLVAVVSLLTFNKITLIKILISFFLISWYFLCLNEKQSLSLFRTILFGYFPIFVGFVTLVLDKKLILISINTGILFILTVLIYEYLIISKSISDLNNISLKKNIIKDIPQFCPTNYLKENNFELLPLGGISNNYITLKNISTGDETVAKSDNFGFNNLKDWNKDSEISYIFLGDSFTYGEDVTHEESFFFYFNKFFPKSLNLGCGGNGPIVKLATFEEYVVHLKPKIISGIFIEMICLKI